MKAVNTIVKIATALAAIAGVVYLLATYGDKIVAWAKKLLDCGCCCCGDEDCSGEECACEEKCCCEEAPAEEAPAEEAPAEEAPAEEAPSAKEEDFA